MVSEQKTPGQNLDIVITIYKKGHKGHIYSLQEVEGFKEVYKMKERGGLNVELKLKDELPPHVDPQEMFFKVSEYLKGKGYARDCGVKYNKFVFAGEDYKNNKMSIW